MLLKVREPMKDNVPAGNGSYTDDYKKALRKCGELLSRRDYSEAKLTEKLLEADLSPEAVRDAIEEMKKAHYLDDRRFAASFVRSYLGKRSLLRIRQDLKERGISGEIIDDVFAGLDREDAADAEMGQIRAFLVKKNYSPETASYSDKQKLMASLYRRGYDPELIRKAVDTGGYS